MHTQHTRTHAHTTQTQQRHTLIRKECMLASTFFIVSPTNTHKTHAHIHTQHTLTQTHLSTKHIHTHRYTQQTLAITHKNTGENLLSKIVALSNKLLKYKDMQHHHPTYAQQQQHQHNLTHAAKYH